MTRACDISAAIGEGLVVLRRESGKLFLLNASSALSWRACQGAEPGSEVPVVAAALAAEYGLGPAVALREAEQLMAGWREAGLIGAHQPSAGDPVTDDWVIAPPPATRLDGRLLPVVVAGVPMALDIPDVDLRGIIGGALTLLQSDDATVYSHLLRVEGGRGGWSLFLNGALRATGGSADGAVAVTLGLVSDLATQAEDRLIVVHGAGLARMDGSTLLLIAPSGNGKSTLATALNARGMALLSDDVVPVNRSGAPIALGMPVCLKSGSWSVLRDWRDDLDGASIIARHGEDVRFLAPVHHPVEGALRLGLLLFPSYSPGADPACEPVSPERALQLIVESQSIIRNVDAAKLEDLSRWVSSVPAFAISYPDVGTAIAQVKRLFCND